jgi:hypothetical protein
MKLASEKSLNRGICPIINIKGKTVSYPFQLKYNNFHLQCAQGIFGAKQMMIMDIIGTQLIHLSHGNLDFSGRIPQYTEKLVKQTSSQHISSKLLKYVREHLAPALQGRIPDGWYSEEGRLQDVDNKHSRIKTPMSIVLNDGQLRKELPFLRKYSSKQIKEMIIQTNNCVLWMNYPVSVYTGKQYEILPFDNFVCPSRLFSLTQIKGSRKDKNKKILEREYHLQFNTLLGFAFQQNTLSSYVDLLPGKFYEMSDYAQMYYRLFIITYFPNKKTGKTPKNPLSIEEIRKRLVLSTKDTSMVRKVIRRILEELKSNQFIKSYSEDMIDRKYVYSYERNSWKEITGEESTSETDLDILWN